MKTLYFECKMGAAGDMLMAALYELYEDKQGFLNKMEDLHLPGVKLDPQNEKKCGISGTKMNVTVYGEEESEHMHDHHEHDHDHHEHNHDHHDHDHKHHKHDHHDHHAHDHHEHNHHEHDHHHEHHHNHGHGHHAHTSYQDVLHMISHLDLPKQVKQDAAEVYRLIGEAESKVHQSTLEQIHFHEVGTIDALADVVGCCYLIYLLEAEKIVASPICVGNGHVHCAHGVLPIPAPATAEILAGVPYYNSSFDGELCTPTGAALLKHFVSSYQEMPIMATEKIGYGLGTKDFDHANCLRVFLGDTVKPATISDTDTPDNLTDEIVELSCNLDDMTPEAIGACMDRLLNAGALDVYTTSIGMKKNRPGIMLSCLCKPELQETLEIQILSETTTLGVRSQKFQRKILASAFTNVQTPFGEIPVKVSTGYGITKCKPEYDAVAAAAKKHQVAFQKVYDAALAAYTK